MQKLIILSCFWLSILISLVNCLYEDQAGTYDWRQQYVGKPLFSHLDPATNRVFLATDQHVLASLNLKTGNIVWRKIFETNTNGQIDYALWASKEAVLVTGNGLRIQGFAYNHGFAKWEYNLFSPQPPTRNIKINGIESRQENEIYYFTNGYQLCYISLKDKACVDLPYDDGYFYDNLFETEQGIFVTGSKNNLVQKLHYNSLLSALLSKTITTIDNENIKLQNCIKSSESNELICYSKEQHKLLSGLIKPGQSLQFTQLQLDSFNSSVSTEAVELIWTSNGVYLFRNQENSQSSNLNNNNDSHEKFKLYLFNTKKQNDKVELNLIKRLESVNNFDIINKDNNKIYLMYSSYLGLNKLNFNVIDLKNSQERSDLLITVNMLDKDFKSIINIKPAFVESVNNQLSLNVFCFFSDFSLTVFSQQGNRYFTREEGLAYITSVEMVDFPLTHLQEEFEDEFGNAGQDNILKMFYKRIRTQLIQLREFILVDLYQKAYQYLNLNSNIKRPITTTGGSAGGLSVEEITRDEFNLNKLMVVVTSIGKVFGLYTGDNGRILWSFYLKNTLPFQLNKFKRESYIPLFLQRTAAHFPYDAQCVLIAKTLVDNKISKTKIFFFNPITGQPSKDYPKDGLIVDYQLKQAFLSNQADANFLKPLFLFDSENKLHVIPEKSVDNLEIKSSKPAVIYSTANDNSRNNALVGYSMKFNNQELSEVWRINLEDEQIVSIASKLSNDHIHSHGKVLGDRSVLYKYLNPNMIGVVTTGQDNQKVPFVNIYLVDTVTGSVIHSFNHKRCRGPVNIVHSENWFFYSYYNIKYRRNEVTSIELFEGSTQFNSTHFSSLDDIKPLIFTKSYIVQKSFDSMQITLTEKGISTKDIIVACQFGVIIEIPWILIDARRPNKMTDVEREENLLPYMPEIPLNYEFTLNYYNYVYNIRGITTAPSGLESTSLVFAYGLDIYFTRVFPSKTFDMLREDFDYFFITTLMVGLLLGTILSKKLASASNLKKAWK